MVGILNNSVRYEVIDEGSNGQKIDNYLIKIIKNVPKSHIYKLLRSGQVRVNKKRVKTDFRLSIGDSVRIPPFKSSSKQSQKVFSIRPEQKVLIEDAVIYEDDALIAINKPSGLNHILEKVKNIPHDQVKLIEFDNSHIERDPIIKYILNLYDKN